MNQEFSLDSRQIVQVTDSFALLVNEAHDNAREHGFHRDYDELLLAAPDSLRRAMHRTELLDMLAKVGSEVGEAVGQVQHGDYDAMAVELADVVIRVLDMCGRENIDLGKVMLEKMMRNRKREYLHGKEC